MNQLEQAFLLKLRQSQAEHAQSSVQTPSGEQRDLFEFGRRCGLYAGLQQAETIFTSLLKEEAEHDR